MRIEEEIQQTHFQSERHKLSVNLLFTSAWMNQQVHQFLDSFGLSGPQFNLLRILRGQHPHPSTVRLLIERMLDKSSNASRIVDKLVEKKLVIRKTCASDRRAVDVWISPKGLALLKEIDQHQKKMDGIFGALSDKEARQLNQLLDKARG